jgi:hypothetical protein
MCLLAPVIAALIRKFVPGQPNSIEPISSIAVIFLSLWFFVHIKKRTTIPVWLTQVLVLLAAFQGIYAILAMFYDIRVAILAVCIRILPIVLVGIAAAAITKTEDFLMITRILGTIVLAMVPVGITVYFFGNGFLPHFLLPIDAMVKLGRETKGGFQTCAGIFNTEIILANTVVAIVFLSLTAVNLRNVKHKTYFWIVACSGVLLTYVTTQRAAFYLGLVGIFVHFIIQRGIKKFHIISAFFFIIVAIIGTDHYTQKQALYKMHYKQRSDLMTDMDLKTRVNLVFIELLVKWMIKTPVGMFLGYSGNESAAFPNSSIPQPDGAVETGAAVAVADTGIIGFMLYLGVIFIVSLRILKHAKFGENQNAVYLLMTYFMGFFIIYYMKAYTVMGALSLAQLVFWAAPGICAKLIFLQKQAKRDNIAQAALVTGASRPL